jgi:hypothetical protein
MADPQPWWPLHGTLMMLSIVFMFVDVRGDLLLVFVNRDVSIDVS